MAEDKNKDNRLGGRYMIQDRDHLSEPGQMGGEVVPGSRGQSEQGQSGSRQHGSDRNDTTGQQGGERRQRRSKLL